ncbi:hypothetical protein Rcae01_02921 [Novipirellula caenicola]|uniref:Uncharacterized protein n=1 Tax=Novipirellula caenicola TaxID=1536901 RepID=A0ABP9VQN9_9BACT
MDVGLGVMEVQRQIVLEGLAGDPRVRREASSICLSPLLHLYLGSSLVSLQQRYTSTLTGIVKRPDWW